MGSGAVGLCMWDFFYSCSTQIQSPGNNSSAESLTQYCRYCVQNASVCGGVLSKHKDLSLDPQHSYKKPSVVACACNHTTGEVEIANPRGLLSR